MAIEVRQVPRGPLGQIWDERVRDWVEEAPHYVQLYLDYREQHYRKICSKCTHARQVKRKCSLLIPGMTERECDHISRAFASKYRTVIRRRYESHPFMQRIRWNMELERSRKERGRGGQDCKEGGLAGAAPAGSSPTHPFSSRAGGSARDRRGAAQSGTGGTRAAPAAAA